MSQPRSSERYLLLDGMRGVAAIAVMFYHYSTHTTFEFFLNAPTAVDLFFALSGFVLTASYAQRIQSGRLRFADYFKRRAIRLYPMFVLGLLLGTAALLGLYFKGLTNFSLRGIVSATANNAFFFPYLNDREIHLFARATGSEGSLFPANGPAWSLFYEMLASMVFFYLVGLDKSLLIKVSGAALFFLLGGAFLRGFEYYQMALVGEAGWTSMNILGGFPRVIWGFCVGIFCHQLISSKGKTASGWLFKIIGWFSTHPLWILLACCALFVIPVQFKGVTFLLTVVLVNPVLLIAGAKCIIQWRIQV